MQDQKVFSAWTIRTFAIIATSFILIGSMTVSAIDVLSGLGGFLIGRMPFRNAPDLSMAFAAAVLLTGIQFVGSIPYLARQRSAGAKENLGLSDTSPWMIILIFLWMTVTTAFWAVAEEMSFRLGTQYLVEDTGTDLKWLWPALIAANVLFALLHLTNFKKGERQPWRVTHHFVLGLTYAYLFAEFGLVSACVAHFLHNIVVKSVHIADRILHPIPEQDPDTEG